MKKGIRFLMLVLIFALLASTLSACAPAAEKTPTYKVAMILPGPISDSDWNTVGYQALEAVKNEYKLETAYSEKVAVADAERVAREYIADGYNIIIFHGGQFVTATNNLAKEHEDVTFIMGSAAAVPNLPANVWDIVRLYYKGNYALGALAARMTKSNVIGFVAGVSLPDFIANLNSAQEAAAKINPDAKVIYSFTGDQNDPVKARQATDAMIAEGADVIINWMNAGTPGVEEAVQAADHPVYMTTFSTDKYERAPKNYVLSLILDLSQPYKFIVGEILKGTRTGVYNLEPGTGMKLSEFHNVPDDVKTEINDIFSQIEKKTLVPTEKTDKPFDQ